MNFVAVWLFFLCTVVTANEYLGKLEDYLGLNKTVFVYSGKYFIELELEQDGTLSMKKLKIHCPSVIKLVTNRTQKQFPIFQSTKFVKQLPNETFEDLFDFYHCVYGPHSATTIPPETTITPKKYVGATSSIEKILREKIRSMRNEQEEEVRSLRNELQLMYIEQQMEKAGNEQTQLAFGIFRLGEAAAVLLNSLGSNPAKGKHVTVTEQPIQTGTQKGSFIDFLFAMKDNRDRLIDSFRETRNKNSEEVMKNEIEQVLKAYRYLVCTNHTDLTKGYLKPEDAKGLLYFQKDYRLRGGTAVKLISKILKYQPTEYGGVKSSTVKKRGRKKKHK